MRQMCCPHLQEPERPKLPDRCTAADARVAEANPVYATYAKRFTLHLCDRLRLAPDPDATHVFVPPAPKPKATSTVAAAVSPATNADWQRLAKLLRLMSSDWFAEARRLINSKRRLCSKIEHFPADLRSGGALDFADRVLALLASPQVAAREKQAFVRALLKFNHAVLFSELGWARSVRASTLLHRQTVPPGMFESCAFLIRGAERSSCEVRPGV